MGKLTVFISYSHKDEIWKDHLATHLKALHEQGLVDLWDDRRISAGDDWYEEIQSAIATASIAILMISPDFLTSNFIQNEEVPRFLERNAKEGLRIIPIIVKPCAWLEIKWLTRFMARPKDGRPLSDGDENQVEADLAAIASEVDHLLKHAGIRAESRTFIALPPDKISLAKLPSTSPDLFGREKELAILDHAWDNPKTNLISLVAWGGVGKTALVNVWLNQMAQNQYRGAERVYGNSFYSQGAAEGKQASADLFIATALAWFGDPEPDKGSPWDKGERLAELIKRQRTLLILDGVEPLQYPPGEMEGRLKDPGLQCLLRELARHNPGLCIVTTRLPVDDLKDFVGASAEQIELEHLSPEAGAAYLKHLGVKGPNDELKHAVSEFDGHALALTLLGRYLAVVYHGDIRQRDRIAQLTKEKKQGGHARRVMEAYERWFEGKPELNILHIMGLFDRPAEGGAIQVLIRKQAIKQNKIKKLLSTAFKTLKEEPAIEGLTSELQHLSQEEWRYALNNLREIRLLTGENPHTPDTIDCHPLVREYFGDKLKANNPIAWRKAHRRLYEYYKNQAKEHPNTIEELIPLYVAMLHGCQAGLHQQVFDEVYFKRIQRDKEFFSWKKLGAFGADLSGLSEFFDSLWSHPVKGLSEATKRLVRNLVGFHLRALGRLAEAAPLMQTGLEIDITRKDWENAAARAINLGELSLTLGDLIKALKYAQQSVYFADRGHDLSLQMLTRTTLADTLHQIGRLDEATVAFCEAERRQKEGDPEYPLLYSYQGFLYCDLLLNQGRLQYVLNRTEQTIKWVTDAQFLLEIGLDHLSLGRSYLQQTLKNKSSDFTSAATHLRQAVEVLRQSGREDIVPIGLLARVELHRLAGDFAKAQRDLDEAFKISTRGGMRLHEVDCHLEFARLQLAMSEKDKARESLTKAEKMIAEMGYHRRDPEIHLIEAQLFLASGEKDMTRESLVKAKELIDQMGMHRWDYEVKEIEEQLGGKA